jgi:hypothetical protein
LGANVAPDQQRRHVPTAVPATDLESLGPELLGRGDRLRVVVLALDSPDRIDVPNREALPDPQPEVVVHREVIALVHAARRLERLPGKEDRR